MCTKICKHEGCDNEAREGKNQCASCANNISRYGVTTPQRDSIAGEQNWQCKICDTPITFKGHRGRTAAVVDHCHTRGHIRGILCTQCNKGIGLFQDNTLRMWAAMRYLEDDDDTFFEEGL